MRKQEIGKEDEPKWIQISNDLLLRLESVLQTVGAMATNQQSTETTAGQVVATNAGPTSAAVQTYGTYSNQTSTLHASSQQKSYSAQLGQQSTVKSSQQSYSNYSIPASDNEQLHSDSRSHIIDIFSGLSVRQSTVYEQDQLNTELYQEYQKLQMTSNAAVLKIREVTSKLPAASLRY